MVKERQFYDLLGVSPSASQAQIKKAYHRLSRQHHPDKNHVSEQFAAIAKAARVLLDEELRGIYDEEGEEGIPDQSEDDLQEKLTDIGTQLQTALQTLHARDAELATAQTAIDESKKALKRARGDETRAVRKVEDVEKQLDELHTNFEQFKKKHANCEGDFAGKERELAASIAQFAKQEASWLASLAERDQQIASRDSAIAAIAAELAEAVEQRRPGNTDRVEDAETRSVHSPHRDAGNKQAQDEEMPELHDEQEHDEQINDASGESQDGHNEAGEIEGAAGAKKPTGNLVVPAGNNAKRSVSIRSRDSQTATMAVDDSAYATTTKKKKRRTPVKGAKRPIYAIKEVPSPAIVAKKAKKTSPGNASVDNAMKRGRGRPRKVHFIDDTGPATTHKSVKLEMNAKENAGGGRAKVKRKGPSLPVGKTVKLETNVGGTVDGVAPPKRGRGRPRKMVVILATKNEEEDSSVRRD